MREVRNVYEPPPLGRYTRSKVFCGSDPAMGFREYTALTHAPAAYESASRSVSWQNRADDTEWTGLPMPAHVAGGLLIPR